MYKTIQGAVGRADPVVFLVGAHEGHDLWYIFQMFPRASVYAFEPLPDAYRKLVTEARKWPRVWTFNVALSDTCGRVPFYVGHYAMTSSLLPVNPGCQDYYQPLHATAREITVSADRLDRFCKSYNVGHIDLLYTDAQGGEGMILDGAGPMLCDGSIKTLFIEMMSTDLYTGSALSGELEKKLSGCGFHPAGSFIEARTASGRLLHADVLWSKR